MLPVYDIALLKGNEDFRTIIGTAYHEMGHASDWKAMPRIYAAAQDFSDERQRLAAFFWVEYLAEKRSSEEVDLAIHREYCEDFARRKWKSFKYNSDQNEGNFLYLCKALSYFMGRTAKSM